MSGRLHRRFNSLGLRRRCVLGLCPLTNAMPIRRLGLLEAEDPRIDEIVVFYPDQSKRILAN